MQVTKTAVVGAGTMGGEIAYLFTTVGLPVVLKDIDRKFIEAGLDRARSLYQRRVDKGKMTVEELEGKLGLIVPTLKYDGFEDVDLALEAVPENLELKQRVFGELDSVLPPEAVIASNTSALSITAMAEATTRPDRVAGMHFFNPPAIMRLVEVVRGRETSDATVQAVSQVCKRLRKLPVVVRDCPGFVVNRVLCFLLREAMLLAGERGGGESAFVEIDEAMVSPAGGMPMGPFVLADILGLDLCLKVIEILRQGYGERFAPPETLVEYVKQGRTGFNAGRGFYEYGAEPKAKDIQPPEELAAAHSAAARRCLSAALAEALRLVGEGIAAPRDVDLAMLSGAGFRNQPFKWADEMGIDTVFDMLKQLSSELGERFAPADELGRMKAAGELGKKTGKGFYEYTGGV